MPIGLNATFQYLAKTGNRVADDVLIAALDSPHPPIRDLAIRAVLDRRSPAGHHEIFRRLPGFDEQCRSIVGERPERLVRVVAEAIETGDVRQCAEAGEAILAFRLYEALPVLIGALDGAGRAHRQKTAQTILELTELFYGELCNPNEQTRRRDQDTARKRMISALEEGAGKYARHGCVEVVEAFLIVSKHQNVVLRRILQQPQESCHRAVVEALTESSRGGVLRLLLGFLEDPQMPQVVKNILAGRTDVKFVENLLAAGGLNASKAVAETLLRFDAFAWAKPEHPVLADLDDRGQADAVALVMSTSIRRKELLDLIGYFLLEGNRGGRRAAARAIREFQGPEADTLVIKALNDDDPTVRAHVLKELRPRNVAGAMSLLIRMVDTPHEPVRQALREAMPEFTVRHFVTNFDRLSDDLVAMAGHLVRKIDPEAAFDLKLEMECLSPVRRRRSVLAAGAMGLVQELEEAVIKLLSDDDHMVRIAAAKALADCDSMPSWDALRDALWDRSVIVQETAEQSLLRIADSLLEENVEMEKVAS
ncbi:MAG: HEAT repeat domain-containing protein [Pirellulales bacterium]|nr:HEAT repeat domain-containing protein [Pirellulales bacterium]